jgi:tellurite methyltransferase
MDTRTKWNHKHKERLQQLTEPEPNARLESLSDYLTGGTALDLACGVGGNSLFLARNNYKVQAIDISEVAIDYIEIQAVKHNLSIQTQVSDLTNFNLNKKSFDLVVITYYLDRSLFPIVKKHIKEGGYFFMETFYQSPQTENQGVSTQYKLKPKELLSEFGDWKVLFFEDNEQEGWQTIFCQKGINGKKLRNQPFLL